MRRAAVMADEIVVVERVKVEAPVLVDKIAQAQTTNQTGVEAAVLLRERTLFVKRIVIHAIVCHPVSFALNMVLQPIADIAAEHGVAAEMLAPEGEIGQHRKHQVEIMMLCVKRIEVIEVAVHAVGAAHHAEVGAEGKPVGETVTGLYADIVTA